MLVFEHSDLKSYKSWIYVHVKEEATIQYFGFDREDFKGEDDPVDIHKITIEQKPIWAKPAQEKSWLSKIFCGSCSGGDDPTTNIDIQKKPK